MKVDTSKLKKGSSELTPECRQLINQISNCRNRSEVLKFLNTIHVWVYGKCELFHWIEILDRFDSILEEAAQYVNENEFMLHCDVLFSDEDTQLLLLVLNFTTLLIEHSFSRHLYNSVEHLTELLSSQNMDIVLAVLNLLYMFSKRSNFIPRLSFEKKELLLIKLFNIAERWGDPNYGLALIDCCIKKPRLEFLYQLFIEHMDISGHSSLLEIPNMMGACSESEISEVVKTICKQLNNPSNSIKMRVAHRVRLISGFKDYNMRLQFVQARLQAVSVLIYSNALQENIDKVLYPGFGEELCELIDKEDIQLVEIRAAVLRTLTSMLHFDRNPNVPRPGSRLPKIIYYTGAERLGGILPLLVRDCIASLTENTSTEKYPLILATSLFSLLYHLASYEAGGNALVKSGMMQSLLRVISWSGVDLEHITFVTRAVRVIDLITNIDIAKFHQNNGLNIFIERLEKEVNCCRESMVDLVNNSQNEVSHPDILNNDASSDLTANDIIEPDDTMQSGGNLGNQNESIFCGDDDIHDAIAENYIGHDNTTETEQNRLSYQPNTEEEQQVHYPANSYYALPLNERNSTYDSWSLTQQQKKVSCVTQRAALLKSMLNFLKKSIQDHAHFNGMRNIMETSLPNSLRHIISNAEFYGPSLFLLATDVFTVYVFNEPSLLSSLQDLGITSIMLQSLLQKDVPATREVLGSLPNVFSAMCLNERGLMEFMSYEPFDKLLKVLLSPDYLVAMRRRRSSDPLGDTATNLGNAMDDLMKHHPYLRTDATEAIVRLLNELVRLGSDPSFICWRANKDNNISGQNSNSTTNSSVSGSNNLNQNINNANLTNESGNVRENENDSSGEDDDDDDEMSSASQQQQQQRQARGSAADQQQLQKCTNSQEREAIPLIDYILNVMKFIEAVFSNSSNGEHCREFVLHGGLKPLLHLLSLPNLPVDSPVSTTAQAIANVCKSILNLSHETKVIDMALRQLTKIVHKLKPLTNYKSFWSGSVLLCELLNCPKLEDGFSIAEYTPLLHSMSSVHGYVVMLVHLCRSASNEMRSILLKRWGTNCETGLQLLQNLVQLYISLVWESTILLSLCSDEQCIQNSNLNWEVSSSHISPTKQSNMKTENDDYAHKLERALAVKEKLKPEEQLRYIKSLLAASSRLGRALAELFGTLVKLSVGTPQSRQRRSNEFVTSISSSKFPTNDAKEIARVLSSILVNGFSHENILPKPPPKLKLTFLICSVGFTGPMLFDDKRSSFHLMISQFCDENGLKAFFDMFYWALSLDKHPLLFSFDRYIKMENVLEDSDDDISDFPDGTGEFLDAWLQLLEKMVNPRAILDSPYSISPRTHNMKEAVHFEPVFYLLQVHRLALITIRRIWRRKPIANYGISMTETMMTILKHLIKSHAMLSERYHIRINEIQNLSKPMEYNKKMQRTADDANINADHLKMLIDMGFMRQHAIEALRNTRSLEQATDYLLIYLLTPTSQSREESLITFNPGASSSQSNINQMDVDVDPTVSTNVSSALPNSTMKEFEIKLISIQMFNQFCEETLTRIFEFMEFLPETINSAAELISVLYHRRNHLDRHKFITSFVKNIAEYTDKIVRGLKQIESCKSAKFDELMTGTLAIKLFIRFKVSTMLLDDMYSDIRKVLCNALSQEKYLSFLISLLSKTEAVIQEQVLLGMKPVTPRWLQNLIELIYAVDNVSVILQRKENMNAVCGENWKWYDASTGKWNSYSEANNMLIKNAFTSGERSVVINIGRQRYTINFNCMTQVSEASGSHRPVLPTLKINDAIAKLSHGNDAKIEYITTQRITSNSNNDKIIQIDDSLCLNALLNFKEVEDFGKETVLSQNESTAGNTNTSKLSTEIDEETNDLSATNAKTTKSKGTEKTSSITPIKKTQKIVLHEERVGLSKFDTADIMICLTRMLQPNYLLNFDTKLSILKLCARLTKDYSNAKIFSKNGGIKLLLNMRQPCGLNGYPTYAIVLIRHVLEAPSVLQDSIERILTSRTSQTVPVGHRDLIYILTQVSSAVARHPMIFLSAAQQSLRVDGLISPTFVVDDSKLPVKAQIPQNRKCFDTSSNLKKTEEDLESIQTAERVIRELLNAIVQPCVHYGGNSTDGNLYDTNKETQEDNFTTEEQKLTSNKMNEKDESCCCSWHLPSNGHLHTKPILPKSTILKILADTVRSYQSLVPRLLVDHMYYASDSILIRNEQSFLCFVLDNFLPIVNRHQNSEVSMISRVLISSLSDCYFQPSVQTKVVDEIRNAIVRALNLTDSTEKYTRLQVLIGLFPIMIESPMLTNKLHVQRNNMYRILLRSGVMTDLCKIAQYQDFSNSNAITTIYSILRPMEILLRLTVAPGPLSSKRIYFGTAPQSGVSAISRRFYPRIMSRTTSSGTPNSVGGDNVLRDIIRNVLSDRRHGFDFIFNTDDIYVDSEDVAPTIDAHANRDIDTNEDETNIISPNGRPQLNLDRLWDDLLQNESLRLLGRNGNSSNVITNNVGDRHHHNNDGVIGTHGNNAVNGSDGASMSSEIAAVIADNTTSLIGDVSTSESDSDSNASTENEDHHVDDEDDDEDDGNEDGVEERSETDADDETRQFIEVFDHIYEPESSETASNDADVDADDEASEVCGQIAVTSEIAADANCGEVNASEGHIISEQERNSNNFPINVEASSGEVSTLPVTSTNNTLITDGSTNESNNSIRTTPASEWITPRAVFISTDSPTNYRTTDHASQNSNVSVTNERSENNVADETSVHMNASSQQLLSSVQRREPTRRLIFLDQQYCAPMPSFSNPTEEGQIELFNQDALHWWLEEAKHLDLESQTDTCLYIAHLLIPFLIKEFKLVYNHKRNETVTTTPSNRRSAIPVLVQQSLNTLTATTSQDPTNSTGINSSVDIRTEESAQASNDDEADDEDYEEDDDADDDEELNTTFMEEDELNSTFNIDFENDHQNDISEESSIGHRTDMPVPNESSVPTGNVDFQASNDSEDIETETTDSGNTGNLTIVTGAPTNSVINIERPMPNVQLENNSETPTAYNLESIPRSLSDSVSIMSAEVRAALGDLEVPEGVDPSFLAALPSEMREEVIQEHLRMQRIRQRAQQNAIQVAHDSLLEVNPEFLAALPPNIQSEVLMQQRIEQQRQAAQTANPEDPVDTAAFFQNLPESLRQAILTDMDESQIASLPPDLAAEAQYLRRDWESRNGARLDTSQTNSLSGFLTGRFPSSFQNLNDESRWHTNSIWYDSNGTPQSQQHQHTTIVHHHQQPLHGKPIALLLMEDENNLLDPDSLSTLLLFLFIEDSKINYARFHRVMRNLCYHMPTREWVINALISIIHKTNDSEVIYSFRNGVGPQWLKLKVDAAFGYKSNIFMFNNNINLADKYDSEDYSISINPQAAQMIVRNCLDLLFVLAKHFPRSFAPFNRENKNHNNHMDISPLNGSFKNSIDNMPVAVSLTSSASLTTDNENLSDDLRNLFQREQQSFLNSNMSRPLSQTKQDDGKENITKFEDSPSTSKAAAIRHYKSNSNMELNGVSYNANSNNVWKVLSDIDTFTKQRLTNVQTFPFNSHPKWKWEIQISDYLSFNDSPFAKLLEMLPYKVICRSPQLTDMLVKLLASLSSELPKEDESLEKIGNDKLLFNSDNQSMKSSETIIEHSNKKIESGIDESDGKNKCNQLIDESKCKRKIYSKNFSQLQLVIEVLTHQCGTSEGLDNMTKLIVNLSQCSQASNAILLQYLISAILGLSEEVRQTIQHLLDEILAYNSINRGMYCYAQTKDSTHSSVDQGVMRDRFTTENIIISSSTNKQSCELQLPAMKKLLSSSAAQPYFLRTLKIFIQVREIFETQDNLFTGGVLNKKSTLSQIICLEDLWNTLSDCLVALEESKDEYAVLVLQPTVEAFFLIHASEKKKSRKIEQISPMHIQNETGDGNTSNSSSASSVNELETNLQANDREVKPTISNINTTGVDETQDIRQVQQNVDRQKFLLFAEKHRTVLNQILRQSLTHLSDGPFAVLVDHTRILDFDVKRKYFQTALERIDEGVRREENTVSVRRVTVFEDSFRVLYRLGPEEWKNRFYVVFEDEEGQDAGGLLREWYVIISREIFNPMYALFCVSPGDRVTYMINPSSHANPNHLSYFKFVGRVIAKAIHDNKLLECYFTRSFYKHILGKQVKYTDMESQDYEFYKGLDYLMKNDISTLGYELTFSTEVQEFGVTQVRDLIPNGRDIAVTETNKFDYVQLVCQLKMSGSIRQQLDAFLEGFYDIIPKHLISIFNEQELELLISGLPDIDIEDLKANTEYHKYTSKSIQIHWFWRALRSFDQADRAKFLQFVTGTSKVPLQGFGSLEGMNGIQKFQIHRDDRSTDRLPCAHTCFNQLDLPMYKSYDKLRCCLLKAIQECSEGFGFA